jgi:hypothetical protein
MEIGDDVRTGTTTGADDDVHDAPLLPLTDVEDFSQRWETIQSRFVDEPRAAVAEADELVSETMRLLADTFAQERARLETDWNRGEDVSTEDLRVALQRYRSFFSRLLRT